MSNNLYKNSRKKRIMSNNLLTVTDFQNTVWNKTSYNTVVSPDINPVDGTTRGVVSLRPKNILSFCFSYSSKLVSFQRNKKYIVSVWVKSNDTELVIQMYTGNNRIEQKNGRIFAEKKKITKNNEWEKITWEFTNPSNSNSDCVSFRLYASIANRYINSLYGPEVKEFTYVNSSNEIIPQNTNQNIKKFSSIYDEYINAVVSIMIESEDGQIYRGSGFFISSDGYIATAAHVIVAGNKIPEPFAKKINVNVHPENKIYEAEIIGVDRLYDVGLIKININFNSERKYFDWFDSREIKIGSPAVTIGNPLGVHVQSITKGTISENKCQDYSWMPESVIVDFSIIGGNSGGPTINEEGKVIGIVSWGYDVGNFSLNGSVSSHVCKKIIEYFLRRSRGENLTKMTYETGYAGIYFRPIGMYETLQLGLNHVQGMQIISVSNNSPAQKAGLKINDLILKADGKNVGKFNNQDLLGTLIHFHPIGKIIKFNIKRGNVTLDINVRIEKLPPSNDYIFANTQTISKLMKKDIIFYS